MNKVEARKANNESEIFYSFTDVPVWANPSHFSDLESPSNTPIDDIEDYHLIRMAYNSLIFLHDDNQTSYFYQIFQKYQSLSGVRDFSEIEIEFMPYYQTVEIHRINVLRHGEIITKTNSCHIYVNNSVRHHDEMVHTGYGQVKIVIDDIQVGDILEVCYSVVGARSSLNKHFNCAVHASFSSIPLLNRCMTIISPNEKQLKWKCHGLAHSPHIRPFSGDENYREYIFNITPPQVSCLEDDVSNTCVVYPYIEVTDFTDWQTVYDALKEPYALDGHVPEKLLVKLKEIEMSSQGLEERVIACINYVQKQYRYQLCSEPYHTFQPFNLSKIVNNGFGDCKDKCLLLIAMLRYFGVTCYPALVNSESPLDPHTRLPSTTVFDHVIVAIFLNDQKFWIDTTLSYEEGQLPYRGISNFGYAFILNDKAENPSWIEIDTYSQRHVHEVYDFSHGDEEPITLKITTTHRGIAANAMRSRLANESKKELSKSYLGYYQNIFSGVKASKDLLIEDDRVKNVFTEVEEYEIPSAQSLTIEDEQYSIQARSLYSYLQYPKEEENRQFPFTVTYPTRMKQTIEVIYPWSHFLKAEDISNFFGDKHFTLFHQDLREGNRQSLDYNFQTLHWSVNPEDMTTYMEAINKAYAHTITLIPKELLNIKWCQKNLPEGSLGKAWLKIKNGFRFVASNIWWGFVIIGIVRVILKLVLK